MNTACTVVYFFHFRGSSLRRVHVFLLLPEKTYPPLFEPKMGVSTPPAPFQQKKAKKGQKKCPGTGNGFFLPLLARKKIFPPAVGQEKDFSSRCLKNVNFSFLYMKNLFGPFLSFAAFLAFFWPFSGLLNCQTFTRRGNYL